MDSQIVFTSENTVKISDDAIDDLLEPIPKEVLIEKIAQTNAWKTKRPAIGEKQSKREYLFQHLGSKLSLSLFRELRTIHEHANIHEFKWLIFTWDKSIGRFYPDKIKVKIEEVVKNLDSLVNLDLLTVDDQSQTIFILFEQWKKEVVADTILSRIEVKIPKYFHIYISISNKMLLVQKRSSQATMEFVKIFEKAFNVVTQEININAMIVREFVKTNPTNLTKLIVKIPQEVAGFGGLSELTVTGTDVIKGSKGLMDRHETSPILVGPWVGVANDSIELKVGEPIKITSIQAALALFNLIKELT